MEVAEKEKPVALVVDDDEFFIKIFARILEKFGFEATFTQNEADFIAKIKAKAPDICFIDLNINGLDSGYALVKSIRNKFGDDLPIYVVSGKSDSKAIAHAIESGATDFILKPVDKEIFASKLGRFFNVESMREEELSYISAPEEGYPAELSTDLTLLAVDEGGVTFHSKHLFPKGTVVYSEGPELAAIFGTTKRLLLSVVTTEVVLEGEGFKVYAELDDPSEEILSNVRGWIRKQH